MKYLVSENCRCDGRFANSSQITSATVRPLHSSVRMLFKRNPEGFMHRFVIVEETWIHWYTPKAKEHRKQLTSPENLFWNAKALLSAQFLGFTRVYIEYLEKGKTVTGLYYAKLLGWFSAEVNKTGLIWRIKNDSPSMTMQRLTHPGSPLSTWLNYVTNCCPIHHVLQIRLRTTTFCFQTS